MRSIEMEIKISFEKKHLYLMAAMVIIISAILLVIATAPATEPTHGTLYTNRIEPKNSTDTIIEVSDSLNILNTLRAQQICDENGAHCKDVSAGWRTIVTDCQICIDCDPNGGATNGAIRCVRVDAGWSNFTGDTTNDGVPGSDNVMCRIQMTC